MNNSFKSISISLNIPVAIYKSTFLITDLNPALLQSLKVSLVSNPIWVTNQINEKRDKRKTNSPNMLIDGNPNLSNICSNKIFLIMFFLIKNVL